MINSINNSYVKFFDKERLKKERELIDSWDYEICHQYGMDCLFVSQKSKFPNMKLIPFKYDNDRKTPVQNDLFFHAYGEISRPEYNEPFATQVYVQFTEDLFAINGFGLNADLNMTLIFNKTSFALDGAMAMADIQTINKTFNFNAEIDDSDEYVIINYKGKNLQFKSRFKWKNNSKNLIEGELFEFNIDPENYVKPDVLNTFKRRYSASHFIETSKILFSCQIDGINSLTKKTKISGRCHANFVVKNPWKAYSDYLDKITPSVGDLVLLNGIDDNIIKLELTEVESENKTAQGISPLLGSYSFKCTAKPYIADNNASVLHDPITAPTDINAKKLIIQTVLNHDASKIADSVSTYEKLYTDDYGCDFTEDDVYGGYDLEIPNGLNNPPNVPINNIPINSNDRPSYKWKTLDNQTIQIRDISSGKVLATYTPTDLYTYLKNVMDSDYISYLNSKYETNFKMNYSMFDDYAITSNGWYQCQALNIKLWYDISSETEITTKDILTENGILTITATISAYTDADRRLHQLASSENGEELFEQFVYLNEPLISFTNKAAYDGIYDKYKIPLIEKTFFEKFKEVINDKMDAYAIDISSDSVYELSSFTNICIDRYVKNPKHKFNLRTDLYDIEQYNIGSEDFSKLVQETTPEYKKWKEINIKKMNGPLVQIYRFEDADSSRLATNGESLFYETTHNEQLYRAEIKTFESDIIATESTEYNSITVPLSGNLNWLEADKYGIYFNNAYGKRIRLYGEERKDDDKMSHLNYENDFSTPENSFILTFKKSKYYLTVQPDEQTGQFELKLNQ